MQPRVLDAYSDAVTESCTPPPLCHAWVLQASTHCNEVAFSCIDKAGVPAAKIAR